MINRLMIDYLQGNDDKVRVILNKADGVDKQQLMRMYLYIIFY